MSGAVGISYAVSQRYAKALIELGLEAKKIEKIETDLDELSAMIEASDDLADLIRSPSINPGEQMKAMVAIADKAKFQDLTKNFLCVLVENRRLYAAEAIIKTVRKELAKQRGEVEVTVQTAQDLTEKQKKALNDAISKSIGKEVSLKATVEPSIMGGMIVTVGSHMIDDSVARKLERLQAAMSTQSNENVKQNTVKEA